MISKTIYEFGREHISSEFVPKKTIFTPSLTDQSYYVVSSEMAKLGETQGSVTSGAYDNSKVTDDIINLRRPGLDITEATAIYDEIKKSVSSDLEKDIQAYNEKISSENEKAKQLDSVLASAVNSSTSVITSE